MKSNNYDKIENWVKTWKKADSELKKVKRNELNEYNYQKNIAVIDDMLQWACEQQKNMNLLFQAGLEFQNYITENLAPLCEVKESPEIMDKLHKLFKIHNI
ncbi:MAG: hypothetical protein GY754_18670 [bacterium]|nr:hypothetical protein [bacterium]